MVKKFLQFYKPYKKLLTIDLSVALIASILSIIFPFLTNVLLKDYIPDRNIKMIIIILFSIFIIHIISAICSYIKIKWGHILGVRIQYDMRSTLFRHLQKLSFNYFDNVKTGHIMSRITNDLNTITEVAHHAPEDLMISFCIITGAFSFMFYINPKLTAISIFPLLILLLWGGFFGRRMKSKFKTVRKKIADINSTVENSVQGIREVKSYANEELEIKKFEYSNNSFKKSMEDVLETVGFFNSIMHFFRDFYYLTIISSSIFLILNGEADVTDLIVFLLYVGIILPPIDRLINFVEQYYQGITSFQRFVEIMEIEPDIKDKNNAHSYFPIKGKLEIKNLYFKYHSSTEYILKNINLKIPPGKSIAIVGESGAGKSSIVSLIPRFYEAQKGEILIDGHNIMNLKQYFLRENIGIVQQNVFLFDTTIRDNILYGKPDATESEIIQAIKLANIYEYIMSLPDGLDTAVGERGIKLSGGQKQRISIARVFLKNPPILIFDEATSSLDTDSEKLIQDALIKICKNRTTIIIAHRLSTIKHVDQVYVVNKGEIVEIGSHKSLVKKRGYYHHLYSRDLL